MASNTGYLQVSDSRTGKDYKIAIQDGYIQAKDLAQITTNVESNGTNGASAQPAAPLRVLDRGFENTAVGVSSIATINGKTSEFHYRGQSLEDLFKNYEFEEVAYLLIWAALPNAQQKEQFRAELNKALVVPDVVKNVVAAFPRDAETSTVVLAAMSAFASSDKVACSTRHSQKPIFQGNLEVADAAIIRTIAYMTTTVALVYCHLHGKTFTEPQPQRSLIGNLLLMMGKIDASTGSDSKLETSLSKLWILFAGSEITNSTAAVLNASSTLTDPISAAIAGLVSGYGPLHGGAVELALEGFEQVATPEGVTPFIDTVKTKETRLYGYGHRVLKERDIRAALIKDVIPTEAANVKILQIGFLVDRAARRDPYFTERDLFVNIDHYGSFPYLSLGFEKNIITSLIILSRVPGALAHWRETLTQPIKIWRPQQIYKPTA